jgi:glycosyltransferase involved in cell wall biosynthesis
MMKKIAFVVQRYGLEVNGGAELHCRQLAEHMAELYDVEVITTKAVDYITWKDEYQNDIDIINGITVRRFSVSDSRNIKKFNKLSNKVFALGAPIELEEKWMDNQGPRSIELVEYLKENKKNYDVFIFFTYLYYTTYYGLREVYDRAILIPTAHDELPIYLGIFKNFFKLPKAIFYNTLEEKKFIEKKFCNKEILNNNGYGGVGIEVPENISASRFIQKYKYDNFIIFIGRIDESKGCGELFKFFIEYKKRNISDLKLLLLGKEVMTIPSHKDIISLGFVSDESKFDALAASRFLVLPSRFESLSMVVLEAMSIGKPVLVNGNCLVLKEHCLNSNAGLYYSDFLEFEKCMNYLLSNNKEVIDMGEKGKRYINSNYQWDIIVKRLSNIIEAIISEKIKPYKDMTTDEKDKQKIIEELNNLSNICDVKTYRYVGTGFNGVIRKIIRKIFKFYIEPIVIDQNQYNSSVIKLLDLYHCYIDKKSIECEKLKKEIENLKKEIEKMKQ